MYQNSLKQRIESIKKLTPSEKKIADFFTTNSSVIAFDNVTSISQKTGVSKATVVRFIARLGYKSFSEFKSERRSDALSSQTILPSRLNLMKQQLAEGKKDVLGRDFALIIQNIEKTYQQIDQDTFMEVAKILAQPTGRLYVTGQRMSYPFAHLFYVLMNRVRTQTTLIRPEISIIPDTIVDLTSKDILFVIFRYPFSKVSLKVAQQFYKKKAKIILLSDNHFSPLSDLCDHQLVVSSEGILSFNSFAGLTALLESLSIACLQFCGDDVLRRLEEGDKLLNEFDVFCSGKFSNNKEMVTIRKMARNASINNNDNS